MTLQQALDQALLDHQAGRLIQAQQVYRQILSQEPGNAAVINLLGLIAFQTGNNHEAVHLFAQAVQKLPSVAEYRTHLGVAMARLGSFAPAIASLNTAVELAPGNADAHNELGNALRASGRMDEAIQQFRIALDLRPDLAPWHNNLSACLMEIGQLDAAETESRKALELDALYAPALVNLGNVLTAKRQYNQAIEQCRRAVELMPNMPEAHTNLGNALSSAGQLDAAIAAFRQAATLAPRQAAAHCNLADALETTGRFAEAIDAATTAIAIQPDCFEAFNNLGNACRQIYRFDEAIVALKQAIALRPDRAEAHNNLGSVLVASGRPREAIAKFRQAIALRPDYFQAHENLATVQLLLGDFKAGWKQYEQRLEAPNAIRLHAGRPRWDGSELAGRRILLQSEQGIGDTLQFIRYIPLVRARGGRIILQCQPPVYPLLKTMNDVEQCVSFNDPPPDFDVQCPLLSLPFIFNTDLHTIPAQVPYIFPGAIQVQQWRQRLNDSAEGQLKIGLVWAGGTDYRNDRNRSMAFSDLAPLTQIPGAHFISLQKGKGAEQLLSHPQSKRLIDWSAELKDFADTAALVAGLDLVISVDTAVAHLAGAMARPVWTTLPFAPDWRWQMDRDDSPWYPTMRLFRQHTPGDWSRPIARITEELIELIRSKALG